MSRFPLLLFFHSASDVVLTLAVVIGLVVVPFLLVLGCIFGFLAANHYLFQPWRRLRRR